MTTERVALFIDYQNVYNDARRAFHDSTGPSRLGQIWPAALGEMIARRAHHGRERTLSQVRVYRGIPTAEQDAIGNIAARRQIAAWQADPRVRVFERSLKGSPGGPLREKGVDVHLATDFVDGAHRGIYDIGVIFSLDADFEPVVELVRDLSVTVEVAAWRTPRRRRNRRLAAHRRVLVSLARSGRLPASERRNILRAAARPRHALIAPYGPKHARQPTER